jgi:hypothetical protein
VFRDVSSFVRASMTRGKAESFMTALKVVSYTKYHECHRDILIRSEDARDRGDYPPPLLFTGDVIVLASLD